MARSKNWRPQMFHICKWTPSSRCLVKGSRVADFTGSPLNARPISVPKKRSWLVQIVDGDVTAQDTALSPSYGEFPPKLPPITPSNWSPVAELASWLAIQLHKFLYCVESLGLRSSIWGALAALKSLSQVPSEHLVPVLSRVIIKKDPVSRPNWGVNRFFDVICLLGNLVLILLDLPLVVFSQKESARITWQLNIKALYGW